MGPELKVLKTTEVGSKKGAREGESSNGRGEITEKGKSAH